jgi:hypothetical protein
VTRQQKQFELAGIVRNRIVERQMLRPGDLLDHPGQWRDHTDAQAQAMAGILREVGIASTLKAWRSERAGGGLVTWDGHLRKSLDPDLEWPVDILDITDAEADYLLSVFDPVSAMATADAGALDALLSSVQSGEAAVTAMLAELAAASSVPTGDDWENAFGGLPDEDRAPFQQMTFTLHDEQAKQVKTALTAAKSLGPFVDSPNENSNGNALVRIAETFLTEHGQG